MAGRSRKKHKQDGVLKEIGELSNIENEDQSPEKEDKVKPVPEEVKVHENIKIELPHEEAHRLFLERMKTVLVGLDNAHKRIEASQKEQMQRLHSQIDKLEEKGQFASKQSLISIESQQI